MSTTVTSRLERLTQYFWQHQHVPFKYGAHDCQTFSTAWVDKELGTSYAQKMHLKFKVEGFGKILRRARNPGGYRAMTVEVTGQAPVEDQEWRAGDVAIFLQDGIETLGITARTLVYAPGLHGLAGFDCAKIVCYWSLECLKPSHS